MEEEEEGKMRGREWYLIFEYTTDSFIRKPSPHGRTAPLKRERRRGMRHRGEKRGEEMKERKRRDKKG